MLYLMWCQKNGLVNTRDNDVGRKSLCGRSVTSVNHSFDTCKRNKKNASVNQIFFEIIQFDNFIYY